MFDDQHNQIRLINLQVLVLRFNRVQDVTWTKVTWWSDDQHLKKDLRSIREDPRYRAKSKYEDRNQAKHKITKKRAHRGDRTLDRTLVAQWPDTPIKRLSRSSDRTLNIKIDRTQDNSVRSSTERFQSSEIVTRRVWWHVTGRWQRPISGSRLQRLGRLDASGQEVISVLSVAEKRDFVPNGYFLSGAYKYNPNRPFEVREVEETYQECLHTILVISTCIVLSDSLGE